MRRFGVEVGQIIGVDRPGWTSPDQREPCRSCGPEHAAHAFGVQDIDATRLERPTHSLGIANSRTPLVPHHRAMTSCYRLSRITDRRSKRVETPWAHRF